MINTILQDRDIELLRFLLSHRGATYFQIKDHLFENIHKSVLYKRLDKLIIKGFVSRQALAPKCRSKFVYHITPKGLIPLELNKKLCHGVKLKSENLKHDLLLSDIITKFKQINIVRDIYTENAVKLRLYHDEVDFYDSSSQVNPDCALTLEQDGIVQNAILEYEANFKSIPRYNNLFKKYSRIKNISYVFYICPNMKLINKLKHTKKSHSEELKPKYFFAEVSTILNATEEIEFTNIYNSKIHLKLRPSTSR